jgi:hypothetical protein
MFATEELLGDVSILHYADNSDYTFIITAVSIIILFENWYNNRPLALVKKILPYFKQN